LGTCSITGVAKVCIAKTEIKSKAINVIFGNIIVKSNTSIFENFKSSFNS